jgi:hypothetical protein
MLIKRCQLLLEHLSWVIVETGKPASSIKHAIQNIEQVFQEEV